MRPSMTDAQRQARFRQKLRALANEPERLPSGNYRDACADCGQIIIGSTPDDVDAARCACGPRIGSTIWSSTPPASSMLSSTFTPGTTPSHPSPSTSA